MIVIAFSKVHQCNIRFRNVLKIYIFYDLITIIVNINGFKKKYDLLNSDYYVKLILEKEWFCGFFNYCYYISSYFIYYL